MDFDYTPSFRKDLPAPAAPWAGFPRFNFIGGHNAPDSMPGDQLAEAAKRVLADAGRFRGGCYPAGYRSQQGAVEAISPGPRVPLIGQVIEQRMKIQYAVVQREPAIERPGARTRVSSNMGACPSKLATCKLLTSEARSPVSSTRR